MNGLNFKFIESKADDGFVKSADVRPTKKTVSTKVDKKDQGLVDAVIKFGKGTKDLVVDESKTLAPAVAEQFRASKSRLDSGNRLIPAIPNSYLYWGIVGLVVYVVAKRV